MKTYFGLPSKFDLPVGCAIGLGVFDGVHVGHQKVIGRVVAMAEDLSTKSLVITFDTHPRGVVGNRNAPKMITSLKHRLRLFEELGVDTTLVLPFNEDFASLTAEEFIREFLIAVLKVRGVVLGYDATFGRDRQGDVDLLQSLGGELNFICEGVESVSVKGETVSSTAIRSSIMVGDLDLAALMLGRTVSALGTVSAGAGIGRTLGFPTLNLDLHHELHPPRGVYVTETIAGHSRWPSVTNIGHRPTIDAENKSDVYIESHVLQGNIGDLYGQVAEVLFHRKIRDEQKFPNREVLMQAIHSDVKTAQDFFAERD